MRTWKRTRRVDACVSRERVQLRSSRRLVADRATEVIGNADQACERSGRESERNRKRKKTIEIARERQQRETEKERKNGQSFAQ